MLWIYQLFDIQSIESRGKSLKSTNIIRIQNSVIKIKNIINLNRFIHFFRNNINLGIMLILLFCLTLTIYHFQVVIIDDEITTNYIDLNTLDDFEINNNFSYIVISYAEKDLDEISAFPNNPLAL